MQDASTQLPSNPEELEGFLQSFETYFIALQHRHGLGAEELTMPEKAIVSSFIIWLRDHAGDGEIAYAHHQAG